MKKKSLEFSSYKIYTSRKQVIKSSEVGFLFYSSQHFGTSFSLLQQRWHLTIQPIKHETEKNRHLENRCAPNPLILALLVVLNNSCKIYLDLILIGEFE
jgi:hypothetical protein